MLTRAGHRVLRQETRFSLPLQEVPDYDPTPTSVPLGGAQRLHGFQLGGAGEVDGMDAGHHLQWALDERYQVELPLDEGGMALVYLAENLDFLRRWEGAEAVPLRMQERDPEAPVVPQPYRTKP